MRRPDDDYAEQYLDGLIAERLRSERHPDASVDGEDPYDIDYFDEGGCG